MRTYWYVSVNVNRGHRRRRNAFASQFDRTVKCPLKRNSTQAKQPPYIQNKYDGRLEWISINWTMAKIIHIHIKFNSFRSGLIFNFLKSGVFKKNDSLNRFGILCTSGNVKLFVCVYMYICIFYHMSISSYLIFCIFFFLKHIIFIYACIYECTDIIFVLFLNLINWKTKNCCWWFSNHL